jgi:hypothetical protein
VIKLIRVVKGIRGIRVIIVIRVFRVTSRSVSGCAPLVCLAVPHSVWLCPISVPGCAP